MIEKNKLKNKRGGFSKSDPGRKDGDYWKNPTVLKILSSVAAGHKTIPAMEILTFYDNSKQYLPKPTLVKYLTRGNRIAFKKKSEDKLSINDIHKIVQVETPMNLVTKEFLIITNKTNNAQIRQTKSREEYIYDINYDLLIDEFIEHINFKITKKKEEVEELISRLDLHKLRNANIAYILNKDLQRKIGMSQKYLSLSKKNKNTLILIPDIHATYEIEFYNKMKEYESRLNTITSTNDADKVIIKYFLRSFLLQYHQLRIEELHLMNIFDNAISHLKRGDISFFLRLDNTCDKWWRINNRSMIFKQLNETLRLIDVDYFDLAPIVNVNFYESNPKDIQ